MNRTCYIVLIIFLALSGCKKPITPVPYYQGSPTPSYIPEPVAPLPYDDSQSPPPQEEPEYIMPQPADNDGDYYPLYYYD